MDSNISMTLTESDEESDYEDAPENFTGASNLSLVESIEDTQVAVHYFFNNNFEEARKIWEPLSKTCMYHSLGLSVMNFLEAMLTFEPKLVQKASDTLRETISVCNRKRHRSSLTKTIGKMVWKANYDGLNDEEVHAELCFAEALLLKALLTFVEDETLVSFIKAGIKIRSCYNLYKVCNVISKTRNWTDSKSKIHFDGGVKMGIGTFNLMISQLPGRAVKLLEFIGFSGSKERGLKELLLGYEMKQSVRQVLCVMVLLGYHLLVTYVVSHEDGDLELCEKILNEQLTLYPNGVWFLFYKGRLELLKGNLDEAELYYKKSWKSQEIWPQFHHLCFWELMWLSAVKSDWEAACFFSDKLLEKSKWSKTIYSYQKAAFLMMNDTKSNEIENLMRTLPEYKQRIAGKSLPMEKFLIKRATRYFAQKKFLCLPTIELIYLWNFFKPISKSKTLLMKFLNTIDNALETLPSDEYTVDNKSLINLLRGCTLRYLGMYMQAENCLKFIIENGKKLKEDTHLVPYAIVELGLLEIEQDNLIVAQGYFNDAKSNYTGYSLESRLHFKVHNALNQIEERKKNLSA